MQIEIENPSSFFDDARETKRRGRGTAAGSRTAARGSPPGAACGGWKTGGGGREARISREAPCRHSGTPAAGRNVAPNAPRGDSPPCWAGVPGNRRPGSGIASGSSSPSRVVFRRRVHRLGGPCLLRRGPPASARGSVTLRDERGDDGCARRFRHGLPSKRGSIHPGGSSKSPGAMADPGRVSRTSFFSFFSLAARIPDRALRVQRGKTDVNAK